MPIQLVLPREAGLKQNLQGWMIFFIVISSVIGAGVFNNGGSAIKVAGPAGALVALLIMSVIAICVSECISELTQLFPVPNAIVEYIRHFVDEDFGWAIGIAYWLTYSSVFAAQNMMAASLSEYWGGSDRQVYRPVVFYFIGPCCLLAINTVGVKLFGWIEAIGGVLKIILVAVTTLLLLIMAGQEHNNELQSGFRHNHDFATSNISAVCYVIPIVAFGFIGIEAVAVTAFEAAPQSLKRPSRIIAYVASSMYLLCMLSQTFNVPWTSPDLPLIYSGIGEEVNKRAEEHHQPLTRILAVVALRDWDKGSLDGVLNGAIIFSVLSASNTALYIASRTLYGMAFRIEDHSTVGRMLRAFSKVDRNTGVPLPALLMSWAMFVWIPFLSLVDEGYIPYMIEIIQTASSVGCLIVWLALTFAYLRYWNWQRKYDSNLRDSTAYTKFRRNTESYKPHTILISLQPWPAIFAFIGCTVVFAFCSATWWYSKVTAPKVLIAYAAQFVVLLIFLVLKAVRYRRHGTFKSNRPIRRNFNGFTARLNDLVRFIKKPSNSSTPLTNLQSSNATSGNEATRFAARHFEQNREAGVEARAADAPLR